MILVAIAAILMAVLSKGFIVPICITCTLTPSFSSIFAAFKALLSIYPVETNVISLPSLTIIAFPIAISFFEFTEKLSCTLGSLMYIGPLMYIVCVIISLTSSMPAGDKITILGIARIIDISSKH